MGKQPQIGDNSLARLGSGRQEQAMGAGRLPFPEHMGFGQNPSC